MQSSSEEPTTTKGASRAMAAERFYVAPFGEPYYDMLKVEAWLKRRTMSAEVNSLVCSQLMRRKEYRDGLVAELARKRGISFEQMWDDIIYDRAQPMTATEYRAARGNAAKDSAAEDE